MLLIDLAEAAAGWLRCRGTQKVDRRGLLKLFKPAKFEYCKACGDAFEVVVNGYCPICTKRRLSGTE